MIAKIVECKVCGGDLVRGFIGSRGFCSLKCEIICNSPHGIVGYNKSKDGIADRWATIGACSSVAAMEELKELWRK